MLGLRAPRVPFDITLPYGLTVTVRPLTTASMAAAQAAARRAVEAIERQVRERTEAGLPLDGLPCARGELGADGKLCPYREHTLISIQEHEAWDVLLACQDQLRLAPSGHVVGINLDVALRLAEARGYDLEVLSELLPVAERSNVESVARLAV